jgi:hypothetical protein
LRSKKDLLMDEEVRVAMQRWPDVPAVHGWLRLDRRGGWHLIDRNQPGFEEALHGQGSPITNPRIVDFIGRNYQCEPESPSQWFWQNGPQRVYVHYDLAPLILRVLENPSGQALVTHTGYLIEQVSHLKIDEQGALRMQTNLGPAALHDLDLAQLDWVFDEQDTPRAVTVLGQKFVL